MFEGMLPRSTPSAAGVDAQGVRDFVRAATDSGLELHSLMIVRGGAVVAQGWWEPYTPDGTALVYSLSKMLTSTAVGIAVGEGLLDLDATVSEALGDHAPARAAAWVHRARVRDLLAMSSGHETDGLEAMMAAVVAGHDPLAAFLTLPAEHAPGEVFTYNQGCTLTLAAILARVTGERLLDWLRPRLLAPLRIDRIAWTPMPGLTGPTGAGLEQGFSGAQVTTAAIAALGELWRREGRWGEEQLVPRDYLEAARSTQVDNVGRHTEPDWQRGYGFQVWRSRHGYRGDGAFGQLCLVLPEQEAVVAVTAQTELMQRELDLVWEHLLPALESGGGTAQADEALERELAALRLEPPPRLVRRPESVVGLLDVDHRVVESAPLLGRVESVRISRRDGGFVMTWRADGADHETPVGVGAWLRGQLPSPWSFPPAVAVAGEAGADGIRVRVVYVESPHALTVTITGDGARMSWVTQPLR